MRGLLRAPERQHHFGLPAGGAATGVLAALGGASIVPLLPGALAGLDTMQVWLTSAEHQLIAGVSPSSVAVSHSRVLSGDCVAKFR